MKICLLKPQYFLKNCSDPQFELFFLPSLHIFNSKLCTDLTFYICSVFCVNGKVLVDESGLTSGALIIQMILSIKNHKPHFKPMRSFIILSLSMPDFCFCWGFFCLFCFYEGFYIFYMIQMD